VGLPLHVLPPAELALQAIGSGLAVSALPPGQAGLAAAVSAVAVPSLSAGELAVVAGPFVAGVPAVEPRLISFSYSFGGANAYFLGNFWEPAGLLRYRVENLTAGGFVYSDWSSLGTVDANIAIVGGMVVGHVYRLAYLLNCEPDAPGWDDAAYHDLGISWTQPSRFAPPVTGDWERTA
jgi:hypothetical protein